MIREFSMNERQMLLKFITGSSRLNSGRTINVQFQTSKGDSDLPRAYTCSEEVLIPLYSSLEVTKQQFRVAIANCGEIDAD